MNIHDIKSFHPICSIKLSSKQETHNKINKYIPIEWQFITMNNGSLTQNLNSLLIKNIQIEMSQKYNITFRNHIHNIRVVWLHSNIHQPLTFAKSIWIINNKYNIYQNILQSNPIGYSLINHEVDIYKEIQEIYCGYCYNLENTYKKSQLIWGRKYKFFYPNKSFVTIEEYFTPNLIKSFH